MASRPIGSQRELVDALTAAGFEVTQATVSRDIAELGLLKAPRADGHAYVSPEDVAGATPGNGSEPRSLRHRRPATPACGASSRTSP